MNLWSVEHNVEHFLATFAWVQQQSNTKPTQKWMTKMVKKCSTLYSTDQRFIRKRNTTYRIHTLIPFVKLFKLELILVTKFEDVPPGLIPIEIYWLLSWEKSRKLLLLHLMPKASNRYDVGMAAWTYLAPASRLRPWNWISWVPTNHRYIGWCSGTNM